ncbi:MAG: hypothetical protein RL186_1551 [Pseudomonadota bacterium]|jgi:hypothetical protein
MSFGQRSTAAPMTSLNLMPDFARDLRNKERAQWQALPLGERMSRRMDQMVAFFDYHKNPDQAPFRIALAAIGMMTLLGFAYVAITTQAPATIEQTPPPALRGLI